MANYEIGESRLGAPRTKPPGQCWCQVCGARQAQERRNGIPICRLCLPRDCEPTTGGTAPACGRMMPRAAPVFPGPKCGDCYGADTL